MQYVKYDTFTASFILFIYCVCLIHSYGQNIYIFFFTSTFWKTSSSSSCNMKRVIQMGSSVSLGPAEIYLLLKVNLCFPSTEAAHAETDSQKTDTTAASVSTVSASRTLWPRFNPQLLLEQASSISILLRWNQSKHPRGQCVGFLWCSV